MNAPELEKQTKPLSDEEILLEIRKAFFPRNFNDSDILELFDENHEEGLQLGLCLYSVNELQETQIHYTARNVLDAFRAIEAKVREEK
jgi:hypothetical protein